VAVHRATDLRRRAEALYGSIDPTDEEELRSLSARLQGAVASKDEHEIAELSDSLSDMLFYLED
jgi:hypothetical protein